MLLLIVVFMVFVVSYAGYRVDVGVDDGVYCVGDDGDGGSVSSGGAAHLASIFTRRL